MGSRYRRDGMLSIGFTGQAGSASRRVFRHFDLNWRVLGNALRGLQFSRVAWVAICSLSGATRFKVYRRGGSLLPAHCPFCGIPDSFAHLPACLQVDPPPAGPGGLAEYPRGLALRLARGTRDFETQFCRPQRGKSN